MQLLVNSLWVLILSSLSGIFYHAGGLAKGSEDPWIPQFMRESWVRDWLCPLFSTLLLFTWWHPASWLGYVLIIPSWIIMAIATSSYWSWLTRLWRGDKDKYWENWLLHGLGIGASFFPFCWQGLWFGWVIINTIASGLLCMWVSQRTKSALIEECGRGFVITIARLFLVIK